MTFSIRRVSVFSPVTIWLFASLKTRQDTSGNAKYDPSNILPGTTALRERLDAAMPLPVAVETMLAPQKNQD